MGNFRKLNVWKAARELASETYRSVMTMPSTDRQVFGTQVTRAALSIAANIAEGSGMNQREFLRYLRIASGSASELESHILILEDVGCIPKARSEGLLERITEIRGMLLSLRQRISSDLSSG